VKYALLGLSGVIPAVLFLVTEAIAQWGGQGGWGMGPGMMGPGMTGWFGPIMMLIFWAAVIVAIILVIRWLVTSGAGSRAQESEASAVEILKKRYARGEIDKAEFEEKKRDLS